MNSRIVSIGTSYTGHICAKLTSIGILLLDSIIMRFELVFSNVTIPDGGDTPRASGYGKSRARSSRSGQKDIHLERPCSLAKPYGYISLDIARTVWRCHPCRDAQKPFRSAIRREESPSSPRRMTRKRAPVSASQIDYYGFVLCIDEFCSRFGFSGWCLREARTAIRSSGTAGATLPFDQAQCCSASGGKCLIPSPVRIACNGLAPSAC